MAIRREPKPRCGGITHEPPVWYKEMAVNFYSFGIATSLAELCDMFDIHPCTLYKWLRKLKVLTHSKIFLNLQKKGLKKCPICKDIFNLEELSYRKSRRVYCHKCENEKYIPFKRKAVLYLGNKCNQCGAGNLPLACFQFHHKNLDGKGQGHFWRSKDWNEVTKELNKCNLLCANCHEILHGGNIKAE